MAKKLYEEAAVQTIADATRSKNCTDSKYKVSEMAAARGKGINLIVTMDEEID